MNADPKSPGVERNATKPYATVDNPPSLQEPAGQADQETASAVTSVADDAVVSETPPVSTETPDKGFYHDDSEGPSDASTGGPTGLVRDRRPPIVWTSSGEALQAKASSWRLKMGLASVIVGGLVYLLTRDFVSAGSVVFAGLLFGFLGARKPQPIKYQIDDRGIIIGPKQYSYSQFRAFAMVDSSASITLMPLQRFTPVLALRYDHDLSEAIVARLAEHLPLEAPRHDMIDSIVNRIKL